MSIIELRIFKSLINMGPDNRPGDSLLFSTSLLLLSAQV